MSRSRQERSPCADCFETVRGDETLSVQECERSCRLMSGAYKDDALLHPRDTTCCVARHDVLFWGTVCRLLFASSDYSMRSGQLTE